MNNMYLLIMSLTDETPASIVFSSTKDIELPFE